MGNGGEHESIDEIFLVILYFFIAAEEGVGVLGLVDAEEVRFSE